MRERHTWWRHRSFVYLDYETHRRACIRATILGVIYGLLVAALLWFTTGLCCASELALGDSLAVGFGQASRMPTIAVVGVSSCRILRMTPTSYIDFVLVSAGTNDPPGPCVRGVRNRLRAGRVQWIVPVNGARATVLAVAAEHGDSLLYYSPAPGNVHPRAYFDVHSGVIGLHRERLGPPHLHHLYHLHHRVHHRQHRHHRRHH